MSEEQSPKEFENNINLICLVSDGDNKDSENAEEENPVKDTFVGAISELANLATYNAVHFHLVPSEEDAGSLEEELESAGVDPSRFTVHPSLLKTLE